MPPQIIPFAEEMKLIGVAVNPAVRRCIFHRFEFVSFFLFVLHAATCQSEMIMKMKTRRRMSGSVSPPKLNLV